MAGGDQERWALENEVFWDQYCLGLGSTGRVPMLPGEWPARCRRLERGLAGSCSGGVVGMLALPRLQEFNTEVTEGRDTEFHREESQSKLTESANGGTSGV
jgi:hypothetical protein